MKPISLEKRELIIAARERGELILDIVKWLGVSESAVMTTLRLYKATGDVAPKPYTGRPSALTEDQIDAISSKVKDKPDATLEEIIIDLSLPIKKSQLHRWFVKHGYVYKKNSSSEQSTKTGRSRETSTLEKITTGI